MALEPRKQSNRRRKPNQSADNLTSHPLGPSETKSLLKAIGLPILIVDRELNVVCEINCKQMGWTKVRGRPLLDILSPVIVNNGELQGSIRAMLAGEGAEFRATLIKDGYSPKTFLVKTAPIASGDNFLGMVLFLDISHEAKLREELNYLSDYSENIIRNIPSGLVVTDNDGKIVLANPAAREMLAAREDLTGKNVDEVFGSSLGKLLIQGRDQFKKGQLEPGEVTIKRMDGVEIVLGFRVAQLFDACHRVVGMIIVFKDVTELKSLRSKLAQTDKMAALGTLASGIAHEFNNLLGAMIGHAQLAKAAGGIDDYKRCVQVVFEGCRRGQEIVHNLLSFSRRRKSTPEEAQLEDLIDQVLILVERDLEKHGIQVKRNYLYRDTIVTDIGQLQQVLLNLIINARQAMEDIDGTRELSISTWEENGFIQIAVKDTGEGMTEENIPHIFEPFFTTKKSVGTGLGLSLCYTLMKNLNGDIRVESEAGKGSMFILTLPQRLPVSEPVPRADFKKGLKTKLGHIRVAVIAKDAMIRDLITKLLTQVGHHVTATSSPGELPDAESLKQDIVVFDLPGPNGKDVDRLISSLADDSRGLVILSALSGDMFEQLKRYEQTLKRVRIVSKPFEAHELIQAMEEVAQ